MSDFYYILVNWGIFMRLWIIFNLALQQDFTKTMLAGTMAGRERGALTLYYYAEVKFWLSTGLPCTRWGVSCYHWKGLEVHGPHLSSTNTVEGGLVTAGCGGGPGSPLCSLTLTLVERATHHHKAGVDVN